MRPTLRLAHGRHSGVAGEELNEGRVAAASSGTVRSRPRVEAALPPAHSLPYLSPFCIPQRLLLQSCGSAQSLAQARQVLYHRAKSHTQILKYKKLWRP